MKSPDKIKKGLEFCKPVWKGNHWKTCDIQCPYSEEASFCKTMLNLDVLALIQQLQAENAELLKKVEQLQAERDALMTFMQKECYYCKHNFSVHPDCPCMDCDGESHFEWRGVQKD